MSQIEKPADLIQDSDPRTYLRRVRVRNYKSIGKCQVELLRLTVLVGRNGAGKSNFLDALRFVVDSLQTSLDHAIKARGGIDEVRRRSTGHPRNFAIELDLDLPGFSTATYGFEIAARGKGGFVVRRERLTRRWAHRDTVHSYEIEEGHGLINASKKDMPAVSADRLYLVSASNVPEFRDVYDALLAMGFYNLNPDAIKELQSPDAGDLLRRDGSNIASVVGRLKGDKPDSFNRIKTYLRSIVPDIKELDRCPLGPRETLEFRQGVQGAKHPWKFYAASMSDGTLRALGALVAVTQLANRKSPVSLVGIEEPETALHPAAAGALVGALREAAAHTQIVVTSHSPDLLDHLQLPVDGLLVVESLQGTTHVTPVDSASLTAITEHLYTAGELLRQEQLELNETELEKQKQLKLFDGDEDES